MINSATTKDNQTPVIPQKCENRKRRGMIITPACKREIKNPNFALLIAAKYCPIIVFILLNKYAEKYM